jgi:hypothetical protein
MVQSSIRYLAHGDARLTDHDSSLSSAMGVTTIWVCLPKYA